MPEDTNVLESGLDIARNNVKVHFEPTKVTGGNLKGQEFLSVTFDIKPTEIFQFFGDEEARDVLCRYLRKLSKGWSFDSVVDGKFDTAKFQELVSNLSARGETVGVLKERFETVFVELNRMWELKASATPEQKAELEKKIDDTMARMKSIQEAIRLKRKTKEEEEQVAADPTLATAAAA